MKVLPCILALALLTGCQTVSRTPVSGGWIRSIEYRGVPENPLLTQRVIRTGNRLYPKIAAILGEREESLTPFEIIFVDSLVLKSGKWGHLGNPIGGVPLTRHPRVVYLDATWLEKIPPTSMSC
jgi:hypothetical protein